MWMFVNKKERKKNATLLAMTDMSSQKKLIEILSFAFVKCAGWLVKAHVRVLDLCRLEKKNDLSSN